MNKPMGVSQWKEHGKKYGYDDYFTKRLEAYEEFVKGVKEMDFPQRKHPADDEWRTQRDNLLNSLEEKT